MKRTCTLIIILLLLITQHMQTANTSCKPTCCPTTCNDVNKTVLRTRSNGTNLALEYTTGWRNLLYKNPSEKWGGNVELSFFYEQSSTTGRTGHYFSPQQSSCPPLTVDCPQTCQKCPTNNSFTFGARVGNTQTLHEDLNLRDFIHFPFPSNTAPSADEQAATMNLELDRSAYGFVFNYHHALDRLVKGSFIKINLPIVRVDHKILSCIKGSALTLGGASNFFSENNVTTALQNYFSGHVVELEDSNQMTTVLQAPLCNALIPSKNVECSSKKQQRRSSVSKGETGVADIDVQVGYHCIYKPNYHASLALSATFPTGNKPDMRRIWSPVVGNGQQWGLGFNGYMDGKIFGCYDEHLYVILGVSYRYLFQTEQCRTLGLCGYQWGHYQLLGQKNKDLLIPAANKLLQRVKIIGGSQVEGILQFNYTNHGFGIDLGYNIFFKEEEEIKLKRGHEVFEPNTYAIAARDYINTQSGGHAFGSAAADFASAQFDDYLTNNNVDLSVAQTPTLITHKIYGGFSYLWKKWNIPVLIGLGGQYEWGNAHEVFENWGITLKTGVSF